MGCLPTHVHAGWRRASAGLAHNPHWRHRVIAFPAFQAVPSPLPRDYVLDAWPPPARSRVPSKQRLPQPPAPGHARGGEPQRAADRARGERQAAAKPREAAWWGRRTARRTLRACQQQSGHPAAPWQVRGSAEPPPIGPGLGSDRRRGLGDKRPWEARPGAAKKGRVDTGQGGRAIQRTPGPTPRCFYNS